MNQKLLIFFGHIGTGKTSVAKKVAEILDYQFINFDTYVWKVSDRKEVYGKNDEFLLTFDEIQEVYDEMHTKALNTLNNKSGVVLESMYFQKQRNEAIDLAKKSGVEYVLVEIVCDESVIKQRLEKRKDKDYQTPGYNLYLQYKDLLEDEQSPHIIINTTNSSIEEAAAVVLNQLNSSNIVN